MLKGEAMNNAARMVLKAVEDETLDVMEDPKRSKVFSSAWFDQYLQKSSGALNTSAFGFYGSFVNLQMMDRAFLMDLNDESFKNERIMILGERLKNV